MVAYLRDNHLPTECDICRLQDAFGCPMSNSLNVPMPMHFRYSMGWPQKSRSDIHAFPSTDSAHVTFCSDLEPAELEGRQSAAFKCQPTLGHAESQASNSRTPTSGLWPLSSPSRCTGDCSLNFATELSFFSPNTANFESYFGFDIPTAPAFDRLPTTSSHGVSHSSPRACFRTSPYTGSSRVSSRSDDLLAVSRDQHQSLPIYDFGGTLAPASQTQSSRPLELMSSTAKVDVSSFSPLRQAIFLDSHFDSSSFDFAMAFAEASYSAQSTGATNPHSTLQPNDLPIGPRELFPPDLFASLNVPPLTPPPSDESRHQFLRFPADLYTPQFVRNHGIEREGWCGLCRPGRWLVLKNSAFWYDKIFMHGISATSGTRFEAPVEMRKTAGKVHEEGEGKAGAPGDGWEGKCGTCWRWMTLGGGRRGGVPWFRHAYRCHKHPKVQDVSKRTRKRVRQGSEDDKV